MTKLENTIKQIIAEHLNYHDPAKINLDDAISGLGADSLDAVEIVMTIEGDFNIDIPDEDWEKVCTAQQAADLVERITNEVKNV